MSIGSSERTVRIPPAGLAGDLVIPPHPAAIVVFAHGSGSSRFSSRNRFVAEALHQAQLATLLLDLLTAQEDEIDSRTRRLRFDIVLLSERLMQATEWLGRNPETQTLPICYFGASTGAAAALIAAAKLPDQVKAVVSRGGRPDLARASLADVKAPTLLIVGGRDLPVIDLNRQALAPLRCEKRLEIVPEASHLFEEPGTLEQVAALAKDWFTRLARPPGIMTPI